MSPKITYSRGDGHLNPYPMKTELDKAVERDLEAQCRNEENPVAEHPESELSDASDGH